MPGDARTPVVLDGVRTPIGKFLGGLASLSAPELGASAVREAVARAGVDATEIDEVILGNAVGAGVGQAPARQAAIGAGLPAAVPAVAVNKVCGSGLKAVMLAAQAVRAGDARLVVAGGFESMSNAPHYLRGMRTGVKYGDRAIQDGLIHDGLWCSFDERHMGGHAEYAAAKAGVTRKEADAFSVESHRRAVAAGDRGEFDREIVPVSVAARRRGAVVVDRDESPRADTSMEALARLRPAFRRDAPAGLDELVVTAGNAPGLNDGAAAVVVASREYATAHGLAHRATITAYAAAGTQPRDLFFAPVEAVRKLAALERCGVDDYGLVELNEAFAVQAVADLRALEMDPERVNVRGGAVALGHPIGASGARILVTLLSAMADRDVEKGLATLCLGGGAAVALAVQAN